MTEEHGPTKTTTDWLGMPLWVGAIGGFILAVALMLLLNVGGGSLTEGGENPQDVLNQSNDIYEEVLISPSTAEFAPADDEDTIVQYLGNDYYFISTYVDSQNNNGATVRDEYVMWLEHDADADEGERWSEVTINEITSQSN